MTSQQTFWKDTGMEPMTLCREDTSAFGSHEAPAGPWPTQWAELSQELLDRARVGWERFVSSIQEPSDD